MDYGGYGDDFEGVQKMTDTARFVLGIIGISGGILCAIADLLLDIKGPDNKKLGKMGVIDSAWERMAHFRFVLSGILAMFAVPMYSCGFISLMQMDENHAISAVILRIIFLCGAMGGFMIHIFLCLQPTMLACNNMPGVLCGYAPTPKDAFLFAQINNGNAISLPLGEEYTWSGEDNLDKTIESLFLEPFGQGYPKSESKRKQKDTALLKDIRRKSQVDIGILLEKMDAEIIHKVLRKNDVIGFILSEGKNKELKDFLRQKSGN
nr:DUF6796 family protein [uncultured Butyrivibrio sp.]